MKKFDWYAIPMSQRAKIAEELGKDVHGMLHKAMLRARKKLERYGYTCDVKLDIFELPKDEEKHIDKPKS